MKVTDLRVREVSVPRIYETHEATTRRFQIDDDHTRSRYQIIELFTDEEHVGLGEVSDVASRMNTLSADGLRDLLAGVMLSADLSRWREIYAGVSRVLPATYHPELRGLTMFGVEIALLDLIGKKYGAPLYELLGGKIRDHVDVSWVAFLRGDVTLEDELQELGDEIRQKIREGFRAFKLKVGEDHPRDLARIELFREIAGPDVYLKVDASGVWEEKEANQKLMDLAVAGVNACETPVVAASRAVANDNPEQINDNADEVAKALARVRAASPIDIIEHVSDLDDGFLIALARHHAVDIVNVIPSQGGGILRSQRLIHVAETAGIPTLLGSTIEMGPGTAAFVHLAVASKGVTVPSDLVSPQLLVDDICKEPFHIEDGTLRPYEKPGLGIEIDEEKMAKWAI
jgi:L-alanine-DL-glutamate epimerase-like enolase superfamily enzyme